MLNAAKVAPPSASAATPKRVRPGFWNNYNNVVAVIEHLSANLNIKKPEDWYKVTTDDVKNSGGKYVLKKYGNSLYTLLKNVYPEHDWKPWLFAHTPINFWTDLKNQRRYLDWVAARLNIKEPSQWYQVTAEQIIELGGARLLKYHNYNLVDVVQNIFPEHEFKPWLFNRVPKGFWESVSNQRAFVSWVGEQIGVRQLSDWYKVNCRSVLDFGGTQILTKYGSFPDMMQNLYPEYDWKPWLFQRVSAGFWDVQDNQKVFMEWMANEFDIKEPQDWKRITWEDIASKKGRTLLMRHGNSPFKLFSSLYPDQDWKHAFGLNKQKSQMRLREVVGTLFPNDEIIFNFKGTNLKFAKSGRVMELDIYLPQRRLALEYQGEHHYKVVHYTQTPLSIYKARDFEKRQLLHQMGITLIEVPYWWDRSKESLAASIMQVRPDVDLPITISVPSFYNSLPKNLSRNHTPLLPDAHGASLPIPTEFPEDVTGIGLLFAQNYTDKVDPTGWWMSEKFDGIRAYWDGTNFISRNYRPLKVPDHIVKQMPPESLDGEIWFGYGSVTECMKIAQKAKSIPWQDFKYCVFDAPLHKGTFEERMEYLADLIAKDHPFMKTIAVTKCEGKSHLWSTLDDVIKKGGEGIMLRKPGSEYESGRSNSLLKVKPYKDDDAVITSGSSDHNVWICKLPNGLQFKSHTKASIRDEIKPGSIIRFQHSGYFMNGRPRTPWIMERRDDITQDKLLLDYHHYYVARKNTVAHCHSCSKELPVNSIRIVTDNAQTTERVASVRTAQFCLDIACVTKPSETLQLPKFDKNIVIPSFQKETITYEDIKKDFPAIQDINWIDTVDFFSSSAQ